jgi:arsenite methyltransferase
VQQEEYINIIKEAGFINVEVKKVKTIELPDEILTKYLNEKQLSEFKERQVGIFSITVVGYK